MPVDCGIVAFDISLFDMATLLSMPHDLPHCHCYCGVMLLPLPCLLVLLPLVDCCSSKNHSTNHCCLDGRRIAAMLPPLCHDGDTAITVLNTMLPCLCCLLVLSPLADCCLSTFSKFLETIIGKMAKLLLQCCCHCTTTLLPLPCLCDHFGAVAAWLIVFFIS